MKFQRNARIFRGQLDATPFAAVLFLLVIFIMMGSLLYTPGVRVDLPRANVLPGTDRPTISIAVDAAGRFYFHDHQVNRYQLQLSLSEAAQAAEVPTLVVQADKAVTIQTLVNLNSLARQAGITNILLATLPPMFDTSRSAELSGKP